MNASERASQPGVGIRGFLNLHQLVSCKTTILAESIPGSTENNLEGIILFIKFHNILHILLINQNENYIKTKSSDSTFAKSYERVPIYYDCHVAKCFQ